MQKNLCITCFFFIFLFFYFLFFFYFFFFFIFSFLFFLFFSFLSSNRAYWSLRSFCSATGFPSDGSSFKNPSTNFPPISAYFPPISAYFSPSRDKLLNVFAPLATPLATLRTLARAFSGNAFNASELATFSNTSLTVSPTSAAAPKYPPSLESAEPAFAAVETTVLPTLCTVFQTDSEDPSLEDFSSEDPSKEGSYTCHQLLSCADAAFLCFQTFLKFL